MRRGLKCVGLMLLACSFLSLGSSPARATGHLLAKVHDLPAVRRHAALHRAHKEEKKQRAKKHHHLFGGGGQGQCNDCY